MAATVHTLTPAPGGLCVALRPGGGAHVEAIVRAYLPPPHTVTVGPPGPDADLALVWWDGLRGVGQEAVHDGPLVALCAGGADVLAEALRAGADYAFALPVSAALLQGVCAAFGRRRRPAPEPSPPRTPSALDLDRRARTVAVYGRPVHLTLREFDLLAYLVGHAGAACSRDELLGGVWGIDFETGTNTVDVFVYSLRRKLRACGLSGAIQTVRGVGYRLAPHLP